jgi:hypothetical protein
MKQYFIKLCLLQLFGVNNCFLVEFWGGKIAKYDILTEKIVFYNKHSDTVTAMCAS